MGKRGPKRKEGKREANGQLDRKTQMQRLNERNAEDTQRIKSVVLHQPHRLGSEDKLLSSALGRFCRRLKASEETYEGVLVYASNRIMFTGAHEPPKGTGKFTSKGGGEGPTAEEIEKLRLRIKDAHDAVHRQFSRDATMLCILIYKIAVLDEDLRDDLVQDRGQDILMAMAEIARSTGKLSSPHPFARS